MLICIKAKQTYSCTCVPRASQSSHAKSGIQALRIRVPLLRAHDTAEVPHRPQLLLEVLLHLLHGPPILVERLLRIERSEVLTDFLLQSISCCSLLFTPQMSPCGSPLAVCLSPRGEALLLLSVPGGGISSPTRRERAEREEGRRVGGVTWCVCVCVCVCVFIYCVCVCIY